MEIIKKKPRVIALIPARLESSRLPDKALKEILGLPMIVHVYRRCLFAKTLDKVFVVTDSEEIRDVVVQYGGEVIMTLKEHACGTDRIAEAAKNMDGDIFVNVQGDEALVNPEYIDAVVEGLKSRPDADVGILVNPYSKYNSFSDIKVVLNKKNEVMYFSRNDIPSGSRVENPPMRKAYHIVPFRRDFLLKYPSLERGELEQIEFNEYLRILENGYKMIAVEVASDAVSVDTQEDLDYVRKQMKTDQLFPKYASL